jgi:hypothetical protein
VEGEVDGAAAEEKRARVDAGAGRVEGVAQHVQGNGHLLALAEGGLLQAVGVGRQHGRALVAHRGRGRRQRHERHRQAVKLLQKRRARANQEKERRCEGGKRDKKKKKE